MSIPITATGNIVDEPALKFIPSGAACITFRIACNKRVMDKDTKEWKDGDSTYVSVVAWRQLAEHIAGSVGKGARVTVVGELGQRNYETKEGEKRTVYEITAEDVSVSMKFGTATFERSTGNSATPAPKKDPWAIDL